MKKHLITVGFLVCLLLASLPSLAWSKGHEDCGLCHKNAAKKDFSLIVSPDTQSINPYTGRPFGKRDALCMSCHKDKLDLNAMHPVGVVPKKATLPEDALGFKGQETELTCESCHDPHPQNKNYMYLRWEASPGKGGLNQFCGKCHPQQGGLMH